MPLSSSRWRRLWAWRRPWCINRPSGRVDRRRASPTRRAPRGEIARRHRGAGCRRPPLGSGRPTPRLGGRGSHLPASDLGGLHLRPAGHQGRGAMLAPRRGRLLRPCRPCPRQARDGHLAGPAQTPEARQLRHRRSGTRPGAGRARLAHRQRPLLRVLPCARRGHRARPVDGSCRAGGKPRRGGDPIRRRHAPIGPVQRAGRYRGVCVVGTEVFNMLPFVSHLYRKIGAAYASRQDARWVLGNGQLLGVFPEGVRAFRSRYPSHTGCAGSAGAGSHHSPPKWGPRWSRWRSSVPRRPTRPCSRHAPWPRR